MNKKQFKLKEHEIIKAFDRLIRRLYKKEANELSAIREGKNTPEILYIYRTIYDYLEIVNSHRKFAKKEE